MEEIINLINKIKASDIAILQFRLNMLSTWEDTTTQEKILAVLPPSIRSAIDAITSTKLPPKMGADDLIPFLTAQIPENKEKLEQALIHLRLLSNMWSDIPSQSGGHVSYWLTTLQTVFQAKLSDLLEQDIQVVEKQLEGGEKTLKTEVDKEHDAYSQAQLENLKSIFEEYRKKREKELFELIKKDKDAVEFFGMKTGKTVDRRQVVEHYVNLLNVTEGSSLIGVKTTDSKKSLIAKKYHAVKKISESLTPDEDQTNKEVFDQFSEAMRDHFPTLAARRDTIGNWIAKQLTAFFKALKMSVPEKLKTEGERVSMRAIKSTMYQPKEDHEKRKGLELQSGAARRKER